MENGVNAIVCELLVAGIARFQCLLSFLVGMVWKGDLVLKNQKARLIEDCEIVLTEIPIDVIAVVGVVNHFLGKLFVKPSADVGIGLASALQEVPPRLKDVALMLELFVKAIGDANR